MCIPPPEEIIPGITSEQITITFPCKKFEEGRDQEQEQEDQPLPRAPFRSYCPRRSGAIKYPVKNSIRNAEDDFHLCAVCQEGLHVLSDGSDDVPFLVHLSCDHLFHAACLAPWLARSNTCPTCRHDQSSFGHRQRQSDKSSDDGLSANPFVFLTFPPAQEDEIPVPRRARRRSPGPRSIAPSYRDSSRTLGEFAANLPLRFGGASGSTYSGSWARVIARSIARRLSHGLK